MKVVGTKQTVERRVEEDGAGILFDAETGKMFVLNETGIWLWEQLREGVSVSQLLQAAREQFSMDTDAMPEVAEQVVDYLLQLHERQLLQLEVSGSELA